MKEIINTLVMGLFFLVPNHIEAFAYAIQDIRHLEVNRAYLEVQQKRDRIYILSAATVMLSYTIFPAFLLRVCLWGIVALVAHYFYTVYNVYKVHAFSLW